MSETLITGAGPAVDPSTLWAGRTTPVPLMEIAEVAGVSRQRLYELSAAGYVRELPKRGRANTVLISAAEAERLLRLFLLAAVLGIAVATLARAVNTSGADVVEVAGALVLAIPKAAVPAVSAA